MLDLSRPNLLLFESGNGHFPRNGREVAEELIERVSPLKVIDQRLQRNSRPDEYRRTAKNIEVRVNDGRRFHKVALRI